MSTPRRGMQVDKGGDDDIDVFASPFPRRIEPRRDSLSVLSERFSSANMLEDGTEINDDDEEEDEGFLHTLRSNTTNIMNSHAVIASSSTHTNTTTHNNNTQHEQHVVVVSHQHQQQQSSHLRRSSNRHDRARVRLSTNLNESTLSNAAALQSLQQFHHNTSSVRVHHAQQHQQQQQPVIRKRSFDIHNQRASLNGDLIADAFDLQQQQLLYTAGNTAHGHQSNSALEHDNHDDNELVCDVLHSDGDAKVSRSLPDHALHLSLDAHAIHIRPDVTSARRHASMREPSPIFSHLNSVHIERDDEFIRPHARRQNVHTPPMSMGSSLPSSIPSSRTSSEQSGGSPLPGSVPASSERMIESFSMPTSRTTSRTTSARSSRASSALTTPSDSTSPFLGNMRVERGGSFNFGRVDSPTDGGVERTYDLERATSSPEVAKMVFAAANASPSVPATTATTTAATGSHSGHSSSTTGRRSWNNASRRRRAGKIRGPAYTSMIDLRSVQNIPREPLFDLDDSQNGSSAESSAPSTRPQTPQEPAPAIHVPRHDEPQQQRHLFEQVIAIADATPTIISQSSADSAANANGGTQSTYEDTRTAINTAIITITAADSALDETPSSPKAHVPLLPVVRSAHADLPSISVETMHRILDGDFPCVSSLIIVDCRFPFEFEGGHIDNAVSMPREDQVVQFFFTDDVACYPATTTVVFHCEFSSCRGPEAMKMLRAYDRNLHQWPNLSYPEMYLLDGGYKRFFLHSTAHCTPRDYRAMEDPAFAVEMNELMVQRKRRVAWRRNKSKSMNAITPNITLTRSMMDLTRRFDRVDPSFDDQAMKTARGYSEDDDNNNDNARWMDDD